MMQLKVVKDEDSEFNDGKFGKSYEEIRKEQLEDGQRDESEDRKEEKILLRIKKLINLMKKMNQHIDKPQISKNLTIQITRRIIDYIQYLFL